MTNFAKNLRFHADNMGISHAKVAERAGLTSRAFSHYVQGDREPNLAALLRISKTVGATPNELLGVEQPDDVDPDDRVRTLRRIQAACDRLEDADLALVEVTVQAISGHLVPSPETGPD